MTRRLALVVTTAALALVPATAYADHTGKATGGGKSPGGTAQAEGPVPFGFAFTAQNPLEPKGHYVFQRPEGTFEGSVTCYSQAGNEAAFSGPITQGTGIFEGAVGQYAYYGVQDNGQGAKATAPDRIQVDIGPQYDGACPISLVYPYEVSDGNIKVHEEG